MDSLKSGQLPKPPGKGSLAGQTPKIFHWCTWIKPRKWSGAYVKLDSEQDCGKMETGTNARRPMPPAEVKLSDPPRAGVTFFYLSPCLTLSACGFNNVVEYDVCLRGHFKALW